MNKPSFTPTVLHNWFIVLVDVPQCFDRFKPVLDNGMKSDNNKKGLILRGYKRQKVYDDSENDDLNDNKKTGHRSMKEEDVEWKTSVIYKGNGKHVETYSQSKYILAGNCDIDSCVKHGNVPLSFAQKFYAGFPSNWQQLLANLNVTKSLSSSSSKHVGAEVKRETKNSLDTFMPSNKVVKKIVQGEGNQQVKIVIVSDRLSKPNYKEWDLSDELNGGYDDRDLQDEDEDDEFVVGNDRSREEDDDQDDHDGFMNQLKKTNQHDGWTRNEVILLRNAHAKIDPMIPNFWDKVSELVTGRSADECAQKWYNTLENHSKKRKQNEVANFGGGKVKEEDPKKLAERQEADWKRIAKGAFRFGKNPENTAKFRREIRELWQQGNKKNEDDICETTPFKLSTINAFEAFVNQSVEKIKTPMIVEKYDMEDDDRENDDAFIQCKLNFSSTPCKLTKNTEKQKDSSPDILVNVDRDQLDSYIINLRKMFKAKKKGQDIITAKPSTQSQTGEAPNCS